MTSDYNRLFFALWPTDEVRAGSGQAARELKIRMQPSGRLIPADRHHVTVLYLGDRVTAEQEAAALRAAAEVQSAPFELKLDHAGSFRNPHGIPWWLGAREQPPELKALYETLRDAMSASGVTAERKRLTPHLTILYDPKLTLPVTTIKPIAWPVTEFVLIRSHIERKPTEYELLGRWPLTGAASSTAPQMTLF